jgi:hypothetical protein
VTKLLDRFGLTNLATVQQKLADRGSQFLASQAIIIGQTTFEVIIKLFIMRREWDGPAVLPPRTAQRMTGGLGKL